MRKVPLGNVCRILSGSTPKRNKPEFWGGTIPWVTPKEISDLSTPYLEDSVEKITDLGYRSCSTKILPPNCVLLSSRAPIGLLAINTIKVCTNQGIKSLIPSSEVYYKYLYYCLKHNVKALQSKGNGATFKELSKTAVEDFEIPLPSLDDQKRIAYLLGKVERLIGDRRSHLQRLDNLLKSVFLDMFGDPVRNEKGWDKKPLQDLCHSPKDIKCGPFGTQLNKDEFQKEGVPVWGIPQINSEFTIPPNDFITTEKATALNDYSVIHNDIVMSRKGTVGKCSLYPNFLDLGIMHSDVLRIRANWKKTNPIYLCWQLRISRDVEKQIANVSSGAIMAGINVGKLKSINVYTPPIGLQNQFATIEEKIKRTKYYYQASLADLETLYGALSQKAFKGELDLSRIPLIEESEKMTTDKTIEPQDSQPTTETYNLPAPSNLAELETLEGRQALLEQWLNTWLEHLNNEPFSPQPFLDAAQQRLLKLTEDNPLEWELGAADYEQITKWLIKSLDNGNIKQIYENTKNQVQVKAAKP